MQTDVFTLITLDVDFNLTVLVQLLANSKLITLQFGPNQIVRGARWHPLGKFPVVIGIELPVCFLLVGAADFYFHSVQRMIVRAPYGAKNERIRLVVFLIPSSGTSGEYLNGDKREQSDHKLDGDPRGEPRHREEPRSSRRLRLPRVRHHRWVLPRLASTRWDLR